MKTQYGSEATQPAAALLTQQAGLETLVYDESTHQAFCLDPVAAQVWRHLDGRRTPAQISTAASIALGAPVTEEAVLFAIAELRNNGLPVPASEPQNSPVPSRRALLRQLGAGAIVMVPAVAAIMAPKAAQAYNGNVSGAVPAKPGRGFETEAPEPVREKVGLPNLGNWTTDDESKKKRTQDGEIFIP